MTRTRAEHRRAFLQDTDLQGVLCQGLLLLGSAAACKWLIPFPGDEALTNVLAGGLAIFGILFLIPLAVVYVVTMPARQEVRLPARQRVRLVRLPRAVARRRKGSPLTETP